MSEGQPQASGSATEDVAKVPRRNLPSIGRCVHYVLAKGPRKGQHRAATITGVGNADVGIVNLTVFLDQSDDSKLEDGKPFEWIVRGWSVPHSDEDTPGTWHWPEQL